MLRRALLLLLITVTACAPVWLLPDLDGTEGRRVQIAFEMAARGDWLVPTLGGEPTWAKPPLHYWLVSASRALFGDSPLALRVPSVLLLFASAWLAGELLRRWFGPRAGWIGALGTVVAPFVVTAWPTAEIDPGFASLTAMAIAALATGVARERRGLVFVSGLLGGLAMLHKGPPFLLFAVGAYLAWWRHRRLRGGLLHFVPMLLVMLAYYGPLWGLRVRPDEVLAVARDESIGRLFLHEWRHFAEIPEYWLRAIAMQVPLGLWCFWEWRGARDARINADDLMLRMNSAACIVAIAALTLFPARPTRYLLPTVPLFTFAVAPAVAHFLAHPGPVPGFARVVLRALWIGGALALLAVPFVPRATLGAAALAAIVAIGARAVRTPRHVVVFALGMPLVVAWTVLLERSLLWRDGTRGRHHAVAVLQRELTALGVDLAGDVRTAGHFDSPLLLGLGRLLPGDEADRRLWQSRWVFHEGASGVAIRPGYRERLRLHLPFKSFVVQERTEGK